MSNGRPKRNTSYPSTVFLLIVTSEKDNFSCLGPATWRSPLISFFLSCPTCNQLVDPVGLHSRYIQNPVLLTTAANMVQATVISHLDYSSSLLTGLSASALILAIRSP